MMKFQIPIALTLFAATGCVADDADAPDEAAIDQEVVTVNAVCATTHANATIDLFNGTESWSRTTNQIDNAPGNANNCNCLNWQQWKNTHGGDEDNPDNPYSSTCRPDTVVDMKWESGGYPLMGFEVAVPSWSLTNGATECNNSTLEIVLWKSVDSNTWQKVWAPAPAHPTMGSDGVCRVVPFVGNGIADGHTYRVHARATRGLDQSNAGGQTPISHGFSGVTVTTWAKNM